MKMKEKAEILTCKKEVKNDPRRFTFTSNPKRLSKRNKQLVSMEGELLSTSYLSTLILPRLYTLYTDYLSILSIDCKGSIFNGLWYSKSRLIKDIYDSHCLKGWFEFNTPTETNYNSTVDRLVDDLTAYSELVGVNRHHKSKYKVSCQWLAYHLYRLVEHGKVGLKYSRDNNFFTDNGIKGVSRTINLRLFDMLVSRGLCSNFIGSNYDPDNMLMSMLVVNPVTLKVYGVSEPIKTKDISNKPTLVEVRYKDEEGNNKVLNTEDYPSEWLPELKGVEEVLDKYNTLINTSKVLINGIPVPELWLRRIYKEDIYTYGRLFDDGSVQTQSKYKRSLIKIDGEETISLDFKSLHPRLAYAWEGVILDKDFDPYPNISIKVDVKLINKYKKFYNITKYNPIRNLTKLCLLCLFNAENDRSAIGAVSAKLLSDYSKRGTTSEDRMKFIGLPKGLPIKEIIQQIKVHNQGISKYLGSNKGGLFQHTDSEIIVDCLRNLEKKGIVALPVHDSLTCKLGYKDDVYSQMLESYSKVVGSEVNCIVEVE